MVRIFVAIVLLATGTVLEAQQQKKVWRLGVFHVGLDHVPGSLQRLKEGLAARGYEEGKNIILDWRNLPDDEAAQKTAEEFVRNKVDLIVAFENQTIRAAKAVVSQIPVVFLHATDPVADGYVESLARPGGNMTGFVGLRELPDKQIELFREIVPGLHRVLVIVDPEDPVTGRLLSEVRKVSSMVKMQVAEHKASDAPDIERILGSVKAGDGDGVFILSPNLQQKFTALTLRLATERHLPMVVHAPQWVEKGGLFSYGHDPFSVGRDAAGYIDRILKGAKPADLPIEQPRTFIFAVNLKTAKQIGLTIPPNVLVRADRVIR
jgi:putative ABC transport system substrate-binding protein